MTIDVSYVRAMIPPAMPPAVRANIELSLYWLEQMESRGQGDPRQIQATLHSLLATIGVYQLVAGDLVVEMEEKIRAAVLAASEEEVKATDGVKIRNVKRIEYEEEHAVAWAADNDHYTLLKLKVRDFETVAKKLKPDFVTLTDERQAIISADLSGVLG